MSQENIGIMIKDLTDRVLIEDLAQKLSGPWGSDWREKLKLFLASKPTWNDEQVVTENPFSNDGKLPKGAIVRRVCVNRKRTLQEALDTTGRHQYVKPDILATAPTGTSEDVELIFIPLGRSMSDKEVDEFIPAGYRLADPWELAAVNEEDPAFAGQHFNFTHWKDANKKWCWAAFYGWSDEERSVRVDRDDNGWNDRWWVAVVRKVSK